MKKGIRIFAAAVLGLALAACSSAEKMAQQAENVTVKCTPVVLEAVAGNVDAQVAVTYPKDYFHPKAILEVTPVLVYEGGEAKGKTLMYQGEKVKDNYKVVPTAGTTVSEKLHFDYVEGMENSHLELRGVARYGKKSVNLPVKKVADGVNTTYMLVKREGQLAFKKDNYQSVIKQTAEGQILYQVNSSEVQSKQLSSQSVKDFQAALDEIAANERKTITGTEVVAYASPEGGEKLNAKLSDNRSKTGEKAFEKITKGKEKRWAAPRSAASVRTGKASRSWWPSPTSRTRTSSCASFPCTAIRPCGKAKSATCPRSIPRCRARCFPNCAAPASSPMWNTRTTPRKSW